MRNFLLLILFFLTTPLTITVSMMVLLSHREVLGASTYNNQPIAFAALPETEHIYIASATFSDGRAKTLSSFFANYNSPLTPFAELMVSKADQYGIDFRLLPAIAMQETTLCKKTLPQAQFNCWGWGIWGKKTRGFSSYEEAIDTISKYFGTKKENGISSLDAIGKIYNPGNTNHWKENVALVMSEL